jgi:hypothetical protein
MPKWRSTEDAVIFFYLSDHAFFDQNPLIKWEAQYWMPYPWSDKSDIPKQWHHVHGTAFSISISISVSIQRGVVSLAAACACDAKLSIHLFWDMPV